MKIKVGIIFGGKKDREQNINLAIKIINSIDKNKYDIVPIYIDEDKTWYTGKMLEDINIYKDMPLLKRYATKVTLCKKNDSFFLINTKGLIRNDVKELHIALPIQNELGNIEGYLETIGIPYIGTKQLESAITQNKIIQNKILESENIRVLPYTYFNKTDYEQTKEEIMKNIKKIGYPVTITNQEKTQEYLSQTEEETNKYIELIKEQKIIVEKQEETTIFCDIIGNYQKQQIIFTEEIEESLKKELEQTTKQIFKLLNLSGVCRIDYKLDKHKKYYVDKINTLPKLDNIEETKYNEIINNMINTAINEIRG